MSRPPELNVELIRLRAEQDHDPSPTDPPRSSSPTPEEIIVRADEVDRVDETPSDRPQRPLLGREGSVPPPPPRQPPPPAPPAQDDGQPSPWRNNTSDSYLSIAQLRNIVTNLPRLEPKAYAYNYDETRTFPEELDEWFQYTEEDRGFLLGTRRAFEQELNEFDFGESKNDEGVNWFSLSLRSHEKLIEHLIEKIKVDRAQSRGLALQSSAYIAMGLWGELEDQIEEPTAREAHDFEPPNDKYKKSSAQLRAIKESALLLCSTKLVETIYSVVRELCDKAIEASWPSTASQTPSSDYLRLQLTSSLTTLYFLVEAGRQQTNQEEGKSIRETFAELKPNPAQYLTHLLARLRWEETPHIPFTRTLLLLWKLILLVFGSSHDRERSKKALKSDDQLDKDKNETFLTASPLDYHAFRQEITSKYPAYNPPPPLVPLEINNNTMLPLVTQNLATHTSQEDLNSLSHGASKSIFHQPTHIATPAPSPPPSPGGPGGKGGKKQNYQTNQNFPFMYPPLDSSSNEIGGKGGAELQDRLAAKRWEGSDIPASILEAAQLFHSRMRMSRALRQLWGAREDFLKYDRGWSESQKKKSKEKHNIPLETADNEFSDDGEEEEQEEGEEEKSVPKPETNDKAVQSRLDAIEEFYSGSFTYLQSIVIVLLKVLLSNITVLGNQPTQNGDSAGDVPELINGADPIPKENLNLALCLSGIGELNEPHSKLHSIEALNSIRTREITSKAISGLILTLLKWLRISRIPYPSSVPSFVTNKIRYTQI
jgi:hypothetical protein